MCKITFFYFFFKLVSQEANSLVLSYSAIQNAGKLASKAAGKLSTDLNSLPTCLSIGALESTFWWRCMEGHTQHHPEANWHQLSISTNPKKQVSPDGKYIPAFLSLTHMRHLEAYPQRIPQKLKKAPDGFSLLALSWSILFSLSLVMHCMPGSLWKSTGTFTV